MMEFSRRKWGWYLTLYSGKQFKIKFLYFKSGKSCSMQRHSQRNELWCFLFGSGKFSSQNYRDQDTTGNWTKDVGSGNFQFVDYNYWHQYYAQKPTLVLEIQTGICEESDIERAA